MKPGSAWYGSAAMAVGALALLVTAVVAAPMDMEDDQLENSVLGNLNLHELRQVAEAIPWEDQAAVLRQIMMLNNERGMEDRAKRAWSKTYGGAGRLAKEWHEDKRHVRFRQCYFNPISCFRK